MTAARAARMQALGGVSTRSLQRWRAWWLRMCPETAFWKRIRALLLPPVEEWRLPASLLERFGDHQTLQDEGIRPPTPLTLEEARRVVERSVRHYNGVRLHSALGYVTPLDRMSGRDTEIRAERDGKLEAARQRRRAARAAQRAA